MSPEEVARYDEYWYAVGTEKAVAARDAALAEISKLSNTKQREIVTVVGAVNLDNGDVAVGIKNVREYKGVEIIPGKYACAEDIAALKLGGNSSNIVFTKAIRPRNSHPIRVCKNCQKIYSKSQFMKGVEFD